MTVVPTKFRKRPVVIEAMHWDGLRITAEHIIDWIYQNGGTMLFDGTHLHIATLEGLMDVSPGDWVIRGVKGEYYSCKPDIFTATYDRVD